MHSGHNLVVLYLALAIAPVAIAQHVHDAGHEGHGGMDDLGMDDLAGTGGAAQPAQGRSAWTELKSVRDAIAGLVESGKLGGVHDQAERIPALSDALATGAKGVPDDKRTRLEATLRQLSELARTLHEAGDAGDLEATRRALKRLDGAIALIHAQYPADLLSRVPTPGEAAEPPDKSPAEPSGHDHGAHSHARTSRPLASVDEAPKATLRVKASEFKFAPTALSMRVGEPTRIELENDGVVEHALIVAAPGGAGDWIHLHAAANSTDAGTYRIDQPGRYPVLCTIQGHTEAGMVGELIVQ